MTYQELIVRENFSKFMKRSYDYLDTRWEPEFKKEVTFVGKVVMIEQ
jgi:hypothetical protein